MADIKKRSRNRVLILPDAVRAVRVIIQGPVDLLLSRPDSFGIEASNYLSIDPTGATAWVSGWKAKEKKKKQASKQASKHWKKGTGSASRRTRVHPDGDQWLDRDRGATVGIPDTLKPKEHAIRFR